MIFNNKNNIPFGEKEKFNAIIEISAGSQKKYAFDQEFSAMRLNRVLYDDAKFPFNYGYVSGTLADDRDGLDVFVISTYPISRGTVAACRPIGMIEVLDRGVNDHKILAIPISDSRLIGIKSLEDLPESYMARFKKFYLDAAKQWGTEIEIKGFFCKDRAIKELLRTQILE